MLLARTQIEIIHRDEDAALGGFHPVTDIGQRPVHDRAHRVGEVRVLELAFDLQIDGFELNGGIGLIGRRGALIGGAVGVEMIAHAGSPRGSVAAPEPPVLRVFAFGVSGSNYCRRRGKNPLGFRLVFNTNYLRSDA